MQSAQASVSVGLNVNFSNWHGEISGNAYDKNNQTGQYGFNVKVKFDRLYTGVDYLSGHYRFSDSGVPGDATQNPNNGVSRTEENLVLGYYPYQYLSVFVKYKRLVFNNGENYQLKNPGVGAQLHYTLSLHWVVFTRISRFAGDFTINGGAAGDSDIMVYTVGAAFRPALHSYISLHFQNQKLDYQYNQGDTETHTLSGFGVSYNYVF